ncbi:MAG: TMEM165/GDT1 family protein [Leptolyngbyaceae cyanobacterium SL_7_1]|nr:TMEM165/GDT1 family protein [Leptolyngbyaceae cyanobacterium SL_7_1]
MIPPAESPTVSPESLATDTTEVTPPPAVESSPLTAGQELQIFASTFVTVFLAELGDKTQVTTLLMSAGCQSPWIVFLGAGSALVATSLVGVLLGRWLSKHVSPKTLELATAGFLLLIAMLLLRDVMQG